MMRRFAFAGAALVALIALSACGGTKRPPAVTTEAGTGAGAAQSQAPTEDRTQPLDMGPDLQPFESEGARGRDLPIDSGLAYGEGGPLADVFFAYDSAALSDEARATLQAHVGWLDRHPAATVVIEGHCDERGTVEYNLALGDQRARSVNDYLVGLGVAPARLATVSYGKERPLDPGSGEAAWSRNRRAHFVVSQ
jgi:peptidoglycan-associated lipoprotein